MTTEVQTPSKKGTSPWVWVVVGCAGLTVLICLVVVAVVGFGVFKVRGFVEDMEDNPLRAVAELAIDRDPDLEVVDSDDDAGTFTVRNLRTGEVATLDFQDIAEGRFSVTTEEGEVTVDATGTDEGGEFVVSGPDGVARIGAGASLDDVPDWVPLFPNATETSGTFHASSAGGVTGAVVQTTDAEVREVLDWFKEWFEDHGYESVGETTASNADGSFGTVNGESPEEGRAIGVIVAETDEGITVTISYSQET